MRTGALSILVPLTMMFFAGCGGGKNKDAETAADVEVDNDDEFEDDMEMMQEFGGMNEEKVTKTFKKLAPALANCLTTQGESERYLSGDVAFLVKVNRNGQAVEAHAEKSNLGSYAAEQCMLDILKSSSWPKPVGGLIGLARWSIGFDAPSDVRPPIHWDAAEVSETLSEDGNAQALSACGGGGPYEMTAYVSRTGQVLSVGVAHADDDGEQTAKCLVDAVKSMTFPSPGSWQAKVSFTR